ncbi:CHASE2 domain-containing protein [Geobacter sp. SVR]|uniref:CHASE2 domain-containing protein n=1 Tax=Geobacter sp. SVR TaxID=2495594 RepID=UPI00143EF5CE|nr:adenylate/guanylate cyclase domain-containing protein [Geobacter sp. SVR]BCS55471.1 adenylate/guanylate cyclase domain-containing protein [Geobacter sp. SVR]GCF83474.1 adenylate/guanylate cyclase domain-containing protein [Geobacter sp. SVR]
MKTVNTRVARFLIGTGVTLCFCLILVWNPTLFAMLEAKLLDARFKARGPLTPPDSVIIATIDEKSLAKLGRWPWSRDVHARLVEKLARAEAAVIAYDVIFPESERNDPDFARAIREAGNVVLPMALDFEQQAIPLSDAILEKSAIVSVEDQELFRKHPPIMSGGVLTVPVRHLEESAMALGNINMFPDDFDGTLRWEHLLLVYDNALYPSLGLRCAAAFLGISPEKLTVSATRGIRVGKTFIPTDHYGRMPINYYGPGRTFRHISIADILDGTVGRAELENRIVFVGPTAIGIYDLRVTPYTTVMPGVEKHASVAASILEKRFITEASQTGNLIFLLIPGLAMALALSRLRLAWGTAASLAGLAVVWLAGYLLFTQLGLWINLAAPLGTIFFSFTSITAWNYAFEERHARRIRAMFSSYVTQTIVNELIKNPDMARLGGEKREVTVLFSDVRGFTTFSEKHSPEEVVAILNEYLGAMTDVILKWEGTLDKFVGDAIVVFWNAPLPRENHAEYALRCALEMQVRLGELHRKWQREGKPPLSCGIGINTGEVVVGNIGADGKKMDYTVIGDHVNLGARVESLTRRFDADLLVTQGTISKLLPAIEAEELKGFEIRGVSRVIVKGKEEPVGLYTVKPTDSPSENCIFTEVPEGEVIRMTEK